MEDKQRKFSKIYEKYVARIYRFIFLKVSSQEIAEDLCSEVFSRAWRKFKGQNPGSPADQQIQNYIAYLYQMARNEIADFYREKGKVQIISFQSLEISSLNPIIDKKSQLKSEFLEIQKMLSKLGEEEQNIVIWRYVDGLKFKEIAQILEKPEGTVRVILHRTLKELQKNLTI